MSLFKTVSQSAQVLVTSATRSVTQVLPHLVDSATNLAQAGNATSHQFLKDIVLENYKTNKTFAKDNKLTAAEMKLIDASIARSSWDI